MVENQCKNCENCSCNKDKDKKEEDNKIDIRKRVEMDLMK